jgi:hypothetical protein
MSELVRNPPRFYVGNLPWLVAPELIEARLLALVADCGCPNARLEIARFAPSKKRKPSDIPKLHYGHGYVYVDDEKMDSLMSLLEGKDVCGNVMKIGHVKHPLPEFVPPPVIPDVEAIEKAKLHRQQRKDTFQKRNEKRVEMLRDFIVQIPLPGGPCALDRYVPLPSVASGAVEVTLNDTAVDWSTVPNSVDPGYDFKRKVPLGDNPQLEMMRRLYHKEDDIETLPTFKGRSQLVGRSSAIVGAGQEHAGMTTRAVRKRCQAGSFYAVMKRLLQTTALSPARTKPVEIVDFASGSGNLCLPLAFLFPECSFTAVDMKEVSIQILLARAQAAGLTNVRGVVGRIENYTEPMDIALALHACGDATGHGPQAERHRAAYIVCPCCIGKLSYRSKDSEGDDLDEADALTTNCNIADVAKDMQSCHESDPSSLRIESIDLTSSASPTCSEGREGGEISHPRSRWLADAMARHDEEPQRLFAAMARAGDISHGSAHSRSSEAGQNHTHEEVARVCKCHLELDRNMHMAEQGYETALMRLLRDDLTGKGDLLVGVPREVIAEHRMQRPWNVAEEGSTSNVLVGC